MCLAPCFKGCTEDRYAEEAAAVERFLATRGGSRLVELCGRKQALYLLASASRVHAPLAAALQLADVYAEVTETAPLLEHALEAVQVQ